MNILVISVYPSSFVKGDIEILKTRHNVTYYNYNSRKINPFKLLKLIIKNELIYFWFASLHFLPILLVSKLLGKKTIIVAGGYDVANVAGIKYGSMNDKKKAFVVKFMLKSADKIISVSESNKNEVIHNCGIQSSKIELIYHGLERNADLILTNKRDCAVTIAFINESSYFRKGIDRYIKLAGYLKETDFHIIGKKDIDTSSLQIPANVIFHGYLKNDEMTSVLNSAKVYIQFSRHEGFGYSVAEAMLFGCIPVVSNEYSLPEVVGECGLIIDDFNDYQTISENILKLFRNYNQDIALRCVRKIESDFNLKKRENKILHLIDTLQIKNSN